MTLGGTAHHIRKNIDGHELTIIAVDPLANEYDEILKRYDISPLVRTQYCDAEQLSEKFSNTFFDLIHIRNALDHSYDPLKGIEEMLKVLKENCFIFMSHSTNEAEKENYVGFHQWNFCQDGDRFVIWNGSARIDVNEALRKKAEVVVVHGNADWNTVEIRKY